MLGKTSTPIGIRQFPQPSLVMLVRLSKEILVVFVAEDEPITTDNIGFCQ
jgi:hypothetical protein